MTILVIFNIVLMSAIVIAIVAMLAAAIQTSRPQVEARRTVRPATRQRPARAHAYRTYEGVNA